MTRALIIEPSGNLWGSERALLAFVSRMPDIEAAVCCPPNTPLIAELTKLPIRIFPFFISNLHEAPLKRIWAAIGVIRACLQFRPEVIYLNQGGCYRVTLPASFLFGLPIIAHVRIYEDITYFRSRLPESSSIAWHCRYKLIDCRRPSIQSCACKYSPACDLQLIHSGPIYQNINSQPKDPKSYRLCRSNRTQQGSEFACRCGALVDRKRGRR